ncbi:hypothetical protein FH972_016795 [Carpinus fangiana]|uniref:Glycosyltransferase family 61 protein n=1 Tax=Carpinus fangiana TaxID=176857 RepID=A0A5N6RK99_9ROSI|nr:hypothetical protein FH972_016795 [Carpinus fangiana]
MTRSKTLEEARAMHCNSPCWAAFAPALPRRERPRSQGAKPAIHSIIAVTNSGEKVTNVLKKMRSLKPLSWSVEALIYRALNSSDAMVGVHGAAMTHFLFMRPGCVFIQVVPLGTIWAAETYYGEPARKLGLKYIGYEIVPKESSLYEEYDKNDPVLRDPNSVNEKGWQYTKSIYLEGQKVRLDLRRFRKRLVRAYDSHISKMTRHESQ